ncbi:hypothetical protein LCGC14_2373250 [marine sediment metagenome]|uniref:Uncharacterized protein n=1 Tax=marine sediment metagenome TaxID=412755 RepID=A0A0F9EFH7_9ZZZZ
MMLTRKSPLTGKEHTMEIDVSETAIYAWQCGELIQVAMPKLNDGEREFIKTGYTPSDWKRMFSDSDANAPDKDGFVGTRL